MREIKFRGKRMDNGEWVCGYLVRVASPCGGGWVIHIPAKDPDDNHHVYEVIPETVGQFTGLCDKNGTEIYEGDVVMKNGSKHEIFFDNYQFIGDGYYNTYYDEPWDIFSEEKELIEVIGNIHDTKAGAE